MEATQSDRLLQFFKVLGHESRLQILGLLANEERNVGELAAALDLKEPTVSHHLAMMRDLGLVRVRAEGNVRFYALNTGFLEQMSKDLFAQENLARLAPAGGADAWEQKVLQTFVVDGQIRQLPSREKKLEVVLRWLVQQFDPRERYPEMVLSRLLKRYHDDHASLRRYLVEHRLMTREKGIYWRIDDGVES